MVQSRIKQLEKMDLITIPRDEKKIYFRFPEPPPASSKVINISNLHKAYGDNVIFNGLNLRIDKGDRIAVVGVNGAGKSTLARIMAGTEPYQDGEIEKGLNTVIGYFAQSQADELNPANSVLEEVETAAIGNDDANPRAALGALLFSGDEALKKTSVLSGGEKPRSPGQDADAPGQLHDSRRTDQPPRHQIQGGPTGRDQRLRRHRDPRRPRPCLPRRRGQQGAGSRPAAPGC